MPEQPGSSFLGPMRQVDFARYLGINKSRITRLKQDGRLVMTPDGLVDVPASLERIQATRGPRYDVDDRFAADRAQVASADAEQTQPSSDDAEPEPLTIDEIGMRTRRAQMLAAEADSRIKARKDALDSGQVVLRREVESDLATAVGVILNHASGIPDRMASLLCGINEPETIRAMLRDELDRFQRRAWEELSAVASGRPESDPASDLREVHS